MSESSLVALSVASIAPRVVLVGNPNAGKTTLFNALSGARAKTANYPGVTVDLRKARLPIKRSSEVGEEITAKEIELIDLPGTYSLEPLSPEERVTSDCLAGKRGPKPDLVVVVLDATNLTRNLYLASEIVELGQPTVVAVNLIDAARRQGIEVNADKLSKKLKCPVVLVSATQRIGLEELQLTAAETLAAARRSQRVEQRESCTANCNGCSYAARHQWASDTSADSVTTGRAGSRKLSLLDRYLTSPIVGSSVFAGTMLGFFILVFVLADWPMALIETLFESIGTVVEYILPSERVSPLIWTPIATVIAIAITSGAYYLSGIKWNRFTIGFTACVVAMAAILPQADFSSLLLEGVIGGVGGIVVFLPQICILFFFISLLEDSGYMARAAFVSERIMRRAGLPGKAFVPMLTSHACAIPGIMAARTIECWRDRLVTILVLPLLTCSARLPVYGMVATLLFSDQPVYAALVFAGAYTLGIVAALSMAWILKKSIVAGDTAPLVIELPPLRWPSLWNALFTVRDRSASFLKNAGSTILLISVVLWGLANYPKLPDSKVANVEETATEEALENDLAKERLEYSYAARIGKTLEPVFAPLGFDWKINVGVLSSFAAREVVVSSLGIVYGIGDEAVDDEVRLTETLRRQTHPDGKPVFSTPACFSLLVFYVLAMQCLPTQVVTRRETGKWKWAIFQLVYMTMLAYLVALIVYQALTAFGF